MPLGALELSGCSRLLLDGGSNAGEAVAAFYRGAFFQCALNGPHRLYNREWPKLDRVARRSLMAPLRDELSSWCVRSFDANPAYAPLLQKQEAALRREGKNLRFVAAALSNVSSAAAPRTITTFARHAWGSTATTLPFADIFNGAKKAPVLGSHAVRVESFDALQVLRTARELNPSSTIALRLDVEGDEEWIMARLADEPKLACALDYLFVEFHHLPGNPGRPGSGRANLTRWGLPEDHCAPSHT